jgi:hypothetical protein
MILSSADPDKFRTYFQPLLAKLKSKGIVLTGMELGNEIDWSNHDLGQSGTGRVLGLDDLGGDAKPCWLTDGDCLSIPANPALPNKDD